MIKCRLNEDVEAPVPRLYTICFLQIEHATMSPSLNLKYFQTGEVNWGPFPALTAELENLNDDGMKSSSFESSESGGGRGCFFGGRRIEANGLLLEAEGLALALGEENILANKSTPGKKSNKTAFEKNVFVQN